MATKIGYTLFTTETTPYAILTHRPTGKLADVTNGAMDDNPAWTDAAVALSQNANHLGYPLDLSSYASWMANGVYDVCFYSKAGANPVNTDARFGRIEIEYAGGLFRILSEYF